MTGLEISAAACGSTPIERFHAQTARRVSGSVLDIGARGLDDVSGYEHFCHLALVGAEISEADLPLQATKTTAEPDQLPFPDRSFDVVVSRFALHRAAAPTAVAAEIARVLRRTGQLLFLETATGVLQKQSRARRNGIDALTHLRISGLVLHDVDWSWQGAHLRASLVQGIATHPDPQYERETAWLRGAS